MLQEAASSLLSSLVTPLIVVVDKYISVTTKWVTERPQALLIEHRMFVHRSLNKSFGERSK